MKYTGGCHCGNVRYSVDLNLDKVIACNCSICSKKGQLLAFAPLKNFTLEKGEKSLKEYQFHTRKIHHLFCTNCGIASFGRATMPDNSEVAGINVRCLDDVNWEELPVIKYDGKSL